MAFSDKRKIIAMAGVSALPALTLIVVAVTYLPTQQGTQTSQSTPSTIPSPPAVLAGLVSARNVSCSLSSGACAFTISNNSTASLDLVACSVVSVSTSVSSGTTIAQYVNVNGTVGGAATGGIPASSQVAATCSVPASSFGQETIGSTASGNFIMKLVDGWDGYPAGQEANFSFQGVWSS